MDNKDRDFLRAKSLYDREISKDMAEIQIHKDKFIKEMKSGLGEMVNDIESYKKPSPSFFKVLSTKIKKIFNAL